MTHELKTIHVNDGTDIARLLREADGHPVRLEKDGIAYSLSREDAAVSAHYDPGAIRDAVRTASGTLTPEEAEALKAYLYKAREEGSRPVTRP